MNNKKLTPLQEAIINTGCFEYVYDEAGGIESLINSVKNVLSKVKPSINKLRNNFKGDLNGLKNLKYEDLVNGCVYEVYAEIFDVMYDSLLLGDIKELKERIKYLEKAVKESDTIYNKYKFKYGKLRDREWNLQPNNTEEVRDYILMNVHNARSYYFNPVIYLLKEVLNAKSKKSDELLFGGKEIVLNMEALSAAFHLLPVSNEDYPGQYGMLSVGVALNTTVGAVTCNRIFKYGDYIEQHPECKELAAAGLDRSLKMDKWNSYYRIVSDMIKR